MIRAVLMGQSAAGSSPPRVCFVKAVQVRCHLVSLFLKCGLLSVDIGVLSSSGIHSIADKPWTPCCALGTVLGKSLWTSVFPPLKRGEGQGKMACSERGGPRNCISGGLDVPPAFPRLELD